MGVSLRALEARFVRHTGSGYQVEPTIESADGISFVCPLCWLALKDSNFDPNVGVRGVHSVLCWRPRVPPDISPGPGRWDFQGSGIHDVTLVAASSSIQLLGGCSWHGYVRNGECVDDLGPESVERARKYHAAWRQTIIDREIAMTGTGTSTATDTTQASSETNQAPGATDSAESETSGGLKVELDDAAAEPVLAGPAGFTKTMDLRVAGHRLQQRWVSGHDGSSVWCEIEGQR